MKVVFIFNEFSLHNHIISDYLRARPNDCVSVIKVPLVLKGKDRLETASSIFPKLPFRFIGGKALEFISILALTLMPKLLRRGAVFKRLRWIARQHQLSFHKTQNVMNRETLEFIKQQEPDLIITLVHQIIRKKLIAIPKLGLINIHPGLLPDFRGIQPYFWELSEDFGFAGPTLHFIENEEIDTGRVLAEAKYATWAKMSVQLNYYLTSCCAAAILPSCVDKLAQGQLHPKEQDPNKGSYYRWPDEQAFRRLAELGHRLITLADLWGIISGRYDSFSAKEIKFCE